MFKKNPHDNGQYLTSLKWTTVRNRFDKFYVLLTCVSIHLLNKKPTWCTVYPQFISSTCTCFGHICSPSPGGVLYMYNMYQLLHTVLQVGRSRVQFPMVSLKFFIDIILPAALWPWGWLSL